MSRNKRFLTILLPLLLLLPLLANWPPPELDIDSRLISLGFLLLVCLVHFLSPFQTTDFLLFTMVMVPVLFSAFHFLASMIAGQAYRLTLTCALSLLLFHFLFSLAGTLLKGSGKTALQVSLSLLVPVFAAFILQERSILLSLVLPALAVFVLYYARSAKRHG